MFVHLIQQQQIIVHCRIVHSSAAGMKAFEDVADHPGLNLSNKHTDREREEANLSEIGVPAEF